MILVEAWLILAMISIIFVAMTAIVLLAEWALRKLGFRGQDSYPRS